MCLSSTIDSGGCEGSKAIRAIVGVCMTQTYPVSLYKYLHQHEMYPNPSREPHVLDLRPSQQFFQTSDFMHLYRHAGFVLLLSQVRRQAWLEEAEVSDFW
jgi:hypothetical protein